MTKLPVQIDPVAIDKATQTLEAGGLVAMPTETVYGLAADARNPQAVARIYEVKSRPRFNPLIAHIVGLEMAQGEAVFSDQTCRLASQFWPGPLTLVLPIKDDTHSVCDLARAGLNTLALRWPVHPGAQALITRFGHPLVAPSANLSGKLSPTCADHVSQDLGDLIDFILDGGPCELGVESTIIDLTTSTPVLLREGAIPAEDLEAVLGPLKRATTDPKAPKAPGMLLRHYAPDARLRLNVLTPEEDEVLLGFGPMEARLNLSQKASLREAAANLFRMLRSLDKNHDRIAVAPIPKTGLGAAINDRLERAARLD